LNPLGLEVRNFGDWDDRLSDVNLCRIDDAL
jgi:hypothetical protein